VSTIRGTLVTDGSSDKVLERLLEWLLSQCGCPNSKVTWADLRALPCPPSELKGKIADALDLYPCEVLFVHRDAESQTIQDRVREISEAQESSATPYVCVIPVRMTEAWMLFDEPAIRRAANNPNGNVPLNLPCMNDIEGIPDPKCILHDALNTASGLNQRRQRKFDVSRAVHHVMDHISDFSPLRGLAAFAQLENNVQSFTNNL